MKWLFVPILMTGCIRDSLEGDWSGDLECNAINYYVTARFFEDSNFQYSGQMLFEFDKDIVYEGQSGVFTGQMLYEFTTVQTETSGGQDMFFDMTWDKVFCSAEFDDGSSEDASCESLGGMDTSTKGDKIGYVEMRYSGSDRLSIDDDNCEGSLTMDGYIK